MKGVKFGGCVVPICGAEVMVGGMYSLNHFLMLGAFLCEVSLGALMIS